MRGALALAHAVAELRQESLFNFGEMTGVKLTAVLEQMLDHSELPDRYLETVQAVFAPPPNYPQVYAAFEEPGCVLVLPREPRAGRSFAAQALLADLRIRTGARVGPLSFGGTDRFPVRRIPQEHDVGYLLELPADEDTFAVADDFGATIERMRYVLRKRSSRLIVLTTPEQWARISAAAPPEVVPDLGLPVPGEVAQAWLRAEEPGLDAAAWLDDPRVRALLVGQGPSDVLQIVSLILNTERRARTQLHAAGSMRDFDERVRSVVAARTNWRNQLLKWHREPGRTSFQRNFLLVASLLRNAPVAHVYAQTAELAAHLQDARVALEGQQAPGVIEMVSAIDADLGDDDTVQFAQPGWDDAALAYFWIDRPIGRKPFLAWMAKAPLTRTSQYLETFTREDRLLLANRVGAFAVRWAVRHSKAEPLEDIVTAWHGDKAMWPVAVELVSAAALHPTMARFTHEVLLRWCKKDSTMPLQKLTVEVCAGEFGRRHTGKALLRLRHAAASPHGEVHAALRGAVRTLWADSSARATLFDSVITWCSKDDERIQAGRRSFCALATLTTDQDLPVLLQAKEPDSDFEPPVDSLSAGWRTLLDGHADDEVADAVRLWMDAALLDPETRPTVFGVLRQAVDVPGCAGGNHPRHRLRDLLYRWQPVPSGDAEPERVQLRHELADLIDHDRSRSVALYRPHAAVEATVPA